MNKLKIGIVGMGFIADWHYKGFASVEEAEIVGMTQDFYRNENKINMMKKELEDKCKKWDIKCYENYEMMVADPEIDALVIGSINPYHYEQIIRAIENKKHLLVEKPIVTDLDQLDYISDLSRRKNIKLFPAHNFVYRGAVVKAKELLLAGKIGKIIRGSFVSAHTISKAHETGWRSKKILSAGGALMDSGHHIVYQSIYLMGKPVKLHAFTSKMILKNMECEDTAQVNLIYADGSMSVLTQIWGSTHGYLSNGIKLIGEKGEIAITDALYLNGEKINDDTDYGNSFVNQAQAFTNYISDNKSPLSSLVDARDTLEIILAAYKSSEQNNVVYLM